jgi:hypothetical protein
MLDIGACPEIPLDFILFLSVHVRGQMLRGNFWDTLLVSRESPLVYSRCNLSLFKVFESSLIASPIDFLKP